MAKRSSGSAERIVSWLRDADRDLVTVVAVRTALRVFPVALNDECLAADAFAVQIFRLAHSGWATVRHGLGTTAARSFETGRRRLSGAAAELRSGSTGPNVLAAHSAGGAFYFLPILSSESDRREQFFEYALEAVAPDRGGDDIRNSILADIKLLNEGVPAHRIARLPLWVKVSETGKPEPKRPPQWVSERLAMFEASDAVRHEGWRLVLRWYRALLPSSIFRSPRSFFGNDADFRIVQLPNKFWGRRAVDVLGELQNISAQRTLALENDELEVAPDETEALLNDLPEVAPGPSFSISSAARLGLASSGIVEPSDVAQIEGVRDVLMEALATLESSCEGSNAFAFITTIVAAYRRDASAEITQLSIDRLFANGVRLENASSRIKREIKRGDLPEQAIHVGEAMDSVISLHGAVVMGTRRGRELVTMSREFHKTESEVAEYKAAARNFAENVFTSKDILEDEAKDMVVAVNGEIGEGRHPERSTLLAQSTNSNLLIAMGKAVVTQSAAAGFLASGAGHVAVAEVAVLVDAIARFLANHSTTIGALAAVAGAELAWVLSLLEWIKRQPNR